MSAGSRYGRGRTDRCHAVATGQLMPWLLSALLVQVLSCGRTIGDQEGATGSPAAAGAPNNPAATTGGTLTGGRASGGSSSGGTLTGGRASGGTSRGGSPSG